MNTVLLIGRPGSGKGTQAKILSKELGWIRLSSGDLIKEIRDGSEPFSARVREMYDKGTLLPDWFADYLLEAGLLELDTHVGVICEGFGRTHSQAVHLSEIVAWLGRKLVVVNLEVSEAEVLRRMMERAKTEDRPDSNAVDKIQERLGKFTAETAPALEYFRELGLVIDIDGELSPEDVAKEISSKLDI